MIGVYQVSGSWVIFLNVSLYHSGADYKLVGGKFVYIVEFRVFYLNMNWSVATAYNFLFKVDLPVKFLIFYYGSSTS